MLVHDAARSQATGALDSACVFPPVGPVAGLVAKATATHKATLPLREAGSVAALRGLWNPPAWVQIPALLVTSSPVAPCASVPAVGIAGLPSTQEVLGVFWFPVARARARTPGEIGLRTCEQLLRCFGVCEGSSAWVGRVGMLGPLAPFWGYGF